jgi:hypothetical protein
MCSAVSRACGTTDYQHKLQAHQPAPPPCLPHLSAHIQAAEGSEVCSHVCYTLIYKVVTISKALFASNFLQGRFCTSSALLDNNRTTLHHRRLSKLHDNLYTLVGWCGTTTLPGQLADAHPQEAAPTIHDSHPADIHPVAQHIPHHTSRMGYAQLWLTASLYMLHHESCTGAQHIVLGQPYPMPYGCDNSTVRVSSMSESTWATRSALPDPLGHAASIQPLLVLQHSTAQHSAAQHKQKQ